MKKSKIILYLWIVLISPGLFLLGINYLYFEEFPTKKFEARMLTNSDLYLEEMKDEDLILYNDYPDFKIEILKKTFKIGVYNVALRIIYIKIRVFSILFLLLSNLFTLIFLIILNRAKN